MVVRPSPVGDHGLDQGDFPSLTFRDLWIYTRKPPSAAELAQLKARATGLGYDVSKPEFPPTK